MSIQGVLEWVMDTIKKGNKEVQERILIMQKEKDKVSTCIITIAGIYSTRKFIVIL